MCTTAAVVGGKSLAKQISERLVINHPFTSSPRLIKHSNIKVLYNFYHADCTLRWSSFHYFWNPVGPLSSGVIRSGITYITTFTTKL